MVRNYKIPASVNSELVICYQLVFSHCVCVAELLVSLLLRYVALITEGVAVCLDACAPVSYHSTGENQGIPAIWAV